MKSVFGLSDKSPKTFDVQEIPRIRKFDERVRFTIYGLTDKAIDSAIGEMEDLCSDIIQDKVIEKDSIAKLSDEQVMVMITANLCRTTSKETNIST